MPNRSLCATFFVYHNLLNPVRIIDVDVHSSLAALLSLQHTPEPLHYERVLLHLLPQAEIPVLQVAIHPVFLADLLPAPKPLPPAPSPPPQAHDGQRPLCHLEAQFQDEQDHQDENKGDPPPRVLPKCTKEATTDIIRRRLQSIDSCEEGLPQPPAGEGDEEGAEDEE